MLYIDYGRIILTTAVISIVLTAPLGAILINTLGIKWLSFDGTSKGETEKFNPVYADLELELKIN